MKTAKEAIVRHDREAANIRTDVQRLQTRIEELNDEITQNNVNDSGRLDELNSQLEEERQELETALASYSDSVVEKDRIDKASKEVKREVDAAHAVVQRLERNIRQAQERSDRQERARQDALRRKNQAVGLLEEAEREKAEVAEERENLARQLAVDIVPQAELVHARIPVDEGMTMAMIDKKLEALVKEQETMNRRLVTYEVYTCISLTYFDRIGGDREEIYERFAAASETFKQAHEDLDRIISDTNVSFMSTRLQWRWLICDSASKKRSFTGKVDGVDSESSSRRELKFCSCICSQSVASVGASSQITRRNYLTLPSSLT